MAKYKVKVSYGGMVSATAGEEYKDKSIINDLLSAGYIEEAKEAKAGDKKPAQASKASKADKPTANKRTKKENKED